MREPAICPSSNNKIEISEAVSAQLAATIRHELETEFAQKARKPSVGREKLAELGEQLKASQEGIEQQVKNAVDKQRKEITTKARTEAEQAVAIEIADRNQELKEIQEKLKLASEHPQAAKRASNTGRAAGIGNHTAHRSGAPADSQADHTAGAGTKRIEAG